MNHRFSRANLAAAALAACFVWLAGPTMAADARCRGSHWVGSWETPPALSGPSYADQTVRVVLNVHRGPVLQTAPAGSVYAGAYKEPVGH